MVAAALAAAVWRRTEVVDVPPATEDGVAAMLAEAIGGEVAPDGFVWEPSDGVVTDAVWGRRILFLGRDGGPADLYRAHVRVSREGRPITVRAVRNLSDTPRGDESQLVAGDRRVAFHTAAFDAVQGVTVLGLDGYDLSGLPLGERWRTRLDHWLETGTLAGLERTELVFRAPPDAVDIELRDDVLVLAVGEQRQRMAVDLTSTTLRVGGRDQHRTEAWAVPPRVKPILHFGMDAMREVLGTETADTIKAWLFRARSRFVEASQVAPPPAATPSSVEVEPPPASWPPAPIPPLFDHPLDHEGQWRPPDLPFALPPLAGTIGEAEPALLQTQVRPDPSLPFAYVRLVAIDTRQLALKIEAGFDEPRPATGPRGRGKIPEEAKPKLVASFNGAFQSRHGSYGMVVDGRVLLPPKAGAATFAVDVFGETFAGPWSDAQGTGEALPETLVSLRQNLEPLIDGGVFNPTGRKRWGFPLDGGSFLTERSALCRTEAGHLVYGWGIEVSAKTLADALLLAGCEHAMHLDMNPGHVGFAFHDARGEKAESALLAREMSIPPHRFLRASPKDFFYLVQRDLTPSFGGASWSPVPEVSPPPAWLPAVHGATYATMGAEVQLWAIDPDRFEWHIFPGEDERGGKTARGVLSPSEVARAHLAVGLGRAFVRDNRRGLVVDGVASLPMRPDRGMIRTSPAGALSIERTISDMALDGDATEVRLMAELGRIRPETRKLRERRPRSGACQLDDGTVLFALASYDTMEPVTRALLAMGCHRVLELDRGNQSRAYFHWRPGDPPAADYEDTALYALASSAEGLARPIDALRPEASPPPDPIPEEGEEEKKKK